MKTVAAGANPMALQRGIQKATERVIEEIKSLSKPVARTALQNATSIAGLLLTTEAVVAELPDKKEKAAAMPDAGLDY